jgi:hypothetical protein
VENDNDPSGQEKLCETAELWRDGLFLTFLLCLFFSVIAGYYHDNSASWALLNCSAVAMAAWLWLPKTIDRFSRQGQEEAQKDGNP